MLSRVYRLALGLALLALLAVLTDVARVGYAQYRALTHAERALSAAAAFKPGLDAGPKAVSGAAAQAVAGRKAAAEAAAAPDALVRGLYRLPLLGPQLDALEQLAVITGGAADAEVHLTSLLTEFQRVRPGAASNLDALGRAYAARLDEVNAAFDDLGRVHAARRRVDTHRLAGPLAAAYARLDAKLDPVSISDRDLRALQDIAPVVLGLKQPTRFLLVLADNAELRPGGGFIGSYATFGFDRGRLNRPHIENIYKLEVPIESTAPYRAGGSHYLEPPEALRGLLEGHSWTLADADWYPSWPRSARLMEERYQVESGQTVDGVVQIDPSLIAGLLGATGPLDVPGFPGAVTASTLVPRTIAEVEKPGLDPITRKAFLSAMGEAFFQRITATPSGRWPLLLRILGKGALGKHLLLYANHPVLQREVLAHGLDGAFKVPAADALSVNLANVGVTKDDSWTRESVDLQVNPGDGTHHVLMTLVNAAPPSPPQDPYGPYVGYLRFYLPLDARDFSGTGFLSGFNDYGVEDGLAVHGGYIRVPVGGSLTVDIRYRTRPARGTYQLTLIKQPGQYPIAVMVSLTGTHPTTFTTQLAEDWRVSARIR